LLAASALDRLPALLRKGREDRLLLGRALLALAAGAFVTWGGFYGVRAYAVPQISVNTGALEREAGELEAAVRHLRAGLALYPRDVIGWIHLALALEQHGDVAAAAQAYRDAEELVPNDAELQRMAARFWARHPGEVGPPRYLDPAAPTLPRGATP
jgi:cytochrome c-type biogenesis protein CcmH/NrfG